VKFIELDMTSAQIDRAIRLGWGGAFLSAFATVLFALILGIGAPPSSPVLPMAIASALITAALGYGVYLRRPSAALTLLTLFVMGRVITYVTAKSIGSPLLTIIFLYCFVEGVRGTLAHRRALTQRRAASALGTA
jgi:hypothetical protein